MIDFPYAIRSFTGYLEGTHKSEHTIKNYRLDLLAFQNFIAEAYPGKTPSLQEVTRGDLDRFRDFLQAKGLKINTRRRQILTVTQFLNFLSKRKKLSPEMAGKIPAPHKVERVPFTVSSVHLIDAIRHLPAETLLDVRNQVLLWVLAETGCLVSEVTQLRFDQIEPLSVELGKKSLRRVPISSALNRAIGKFKMLGKESPWLFLGFNKGGSLGQPMTPRGVELLVKSYGPQLGLGADSGKLTPRTFRHSAIVEWFKDNVSLPEIQARLGLKTAYAFRSYESLIKSSSETTSTGGTNPTGF